MYDEMGRRQRALHACVDKLRAEREVREQKLALARELRDALQAEQAAERQALEKEEQRRAWEEGQRLLRAEIEGHTVKQQAEIDALRLEMATALEEKDEQLRKMSEEFGVQLLTKEQEGAKALAPALGGLSQLHSLYLHGGYTGGEAQAYFGSECDWVCMAVVNLLCERTGYDWLSE